MNGTNYICHIQLVGFECAGLHPDMAKDHWRGLELYNVTVKAEKLGNLYYNETLSWLMIFIL
jgi:hypothetical protein